MDIKLLNTIISDLPDSSKVSDGISTFGDLHRNLLSLYINFLDLLEVIYSSKGVHNPFWISKKDSEGEEIKGFIHLGIFPNDSKLELGLLVPADIWKIYEIKSKVLDMAPRYKNLYECLPNYFYDYDKSI